MTSSMKDYEDEEAKHKMAYAKECARRLQTEKYDDPFFSNAWCATHDLLAVLDVMSLDEARAFLKKQAEGVHRINAEDPQSGRRLKNYVRDRRRSERSDAEWKATCENFYEFCRQETEREARGEKRVRVKGKSFGARINQVKEIQP